MTTDATDQPPRVGVITVVYRSNHVLPGFLRSLPDAIGEPFATIIADNRPGDGSHAPALAEEHGATYLPLPENLGYGGAVNAAAAELTPDLSWIVISNPDVVFRLGSIARLIATAEADPGIGAVGPAVENLDGTIYPSARAIPSLRTGIGHALFAYIWKSNPWTAAYRDGAAVSGERRDVGWLSGSCFLVRRAAFEAIGGFDDGYFMYFEDVDLGHRLSRAGYRNVYEPDARALHTGAHSTGAESARMTRAHHDSAKRFLHRKYRAWYLWPVRAVLSIGLSVRAAIMARAVGRR
ncbi:glycosyltransferase family 2 protein [Microcella alkalica]|uniref:N-acetylglucosaminyl-diphospho-decaprenol L-rhamnosyltransferase n=1 Tax=Microcella alkalica TaxID=355930 RepID=A0A839EB22_9MICO|nr:glycosyltransferase family 2 protein [Microcella alkalica]MBA8848930.1 N-acetylglucosaminyl-diphospho-decaprenol L-rhamnosyltransferase [Microcella alkalica]